MKLTSKILVGRKNGLNRQKNYLIFPSCVSLGVCVTPTGPRTSGPSTMLSTRFWPWRPGGRDCWAWTRGRPPWRVDSSKIFRLHNWMIHNPLHNHQKIYNIFSKTYMYGTVYNWPSSASRCMFVIRRGTWFNFLCWCFVFNFICPKFIEKQRFVRSMPCCRMCRLWPRSCSR
jgi:hypothetical protein